MKTNELYEKVRTAEVGRVLKHRGKVGTVERDDSEYSCDGCVYYLPAGRCLAVFLALDGALIPCVSKNRPDGLSIIVRENKEGASC
jgi:hypothetical protein